MSNLLNQLEQLQSALTRLTDKYQYVTSELARVKAQPSVTSEQMAEIQAKLGATEERIAMLEESIDEHETAKAELEQRYQSLADSHNLLSKEYEDAQAQIENLTQINQKLVEKNQIAAEHTKVVLERLAKIDSEENE